MLLMKETKPGSGLRERGEVVSETYPPLPTEEKRYGAPATQFLISQMNQPTPEHLRRAVAD